MLDNSSNVKCNTACDTLFFRAGHAKTLPRQREYQDVGDLGAQSLYCKTPILATIVI